MCREKESNRPRQHTEGKDFCMKRIGKKGILFFICVVLFLGIAACGRQEPDTVRVGSMKGATSLGLLALMNREPQENAGNVYQFQMAVGADELLPLLAKGELDIALLPANAAANLYAKTNGEVAVIDINTLGVLYLVTGDKEVTAMEDLEGRTVYLTGKGTTPEASLRYLLQQAGVENCTLEFRSEPTEVVAMLSADPKAIGLLPQPFVTAALLQKDTLSVVVDLNEVWCNTAGGEGGMVTGVTVASRAFLESHPQAVNTFLQDHADSVSAVNADVEQAAGWAVEAGIVGAEPVAKRAIPDCNLVCITGEEMEKALSSYLKVLDDFDSKLIGGGLPGEDFYWKK